MYSKEACSLSVPVLDDYLTFSLPITFPQTSHISALPTQITNPSPSGRLGMRLCSPVSTLGCLMDKPLLRCSACLLSIWLAADGSVVKNLPIDAECRRHGVNPGSRRFLEEGMATCSSILPGKSMDRGACWTKVCRVTKSRTCLSTHALWGNQTWFGNLYNSEN